MLKKAMVLTLPTPARVSPANPEPARPAPFPWDAPLPSFVSRIDPWLKGRPGKERSWQLGAGG